MTTLVELIVWCLKQETIILANVEHAQWRQLSSAGANGLYHHAATLESSKRDLERDTHARARRENSNSTFNFSK